MTVDLKTLLGIDTPCPCGVGMLRTEIDHQRGHCDICHMMKPGFKLIPDPPAKRWGPHPPGRPHEPNWGGDYPMPEHWWESDYE